MSSDTSPDAKPVARSNNDSGLVAQPHITREPFNGWASAKDPAEFLGPELYQFEINLMFDLPPGAQERAWELRDEVYGRVYSAIAAGVVGRTSASVVDYVDSKVPGEGPRRYIKAQMVTARDNQITTLFRCYPVGPRLYIAADSYRLGRVDVRAVVLRVAYSVLAFGLALASTPFLFFLGWPLFVFLLWFLWGRTIRASAGGDLAMGLRATFTRPLRNSSFDTDDTLIFLKSLGPTIFDALRSLGPRFGYDMSSTEELLHQMQDKLNMTTINVSNSGSMNGVAIGGSGNRASSGR
jgi:hypothetical protein